jgi:hypothetical protein
MILVPRQLQRSGMTGNVPYYGGRFTPAQAYAASHPSRPSPPVAPPVVPAVPPAAADPDPEQTLRNLQQLLDSGVVTPEEYRRLRDRVAT